MTIDHMGPNGAPGPEASPALRLAAELMLPEAIINPDPAAYREGAGILHDYFEGRLQGEETPGAEDSDFVNVVDTTASTLGGFYARDGLSSQSTSRGTIGSHSADASLVSALKVVYEAQAQQEASGKILLHGSAQTGAMITELDFFTTRDVSEEVGAAAGSRPLRHRAADALRNATRSVDGDPASYPQLAQVGVHMTEAVSALADVAGRHPNDTGLVGEFRDGRIVSVPGEAVHFKDYLARHMSSALRFTQPRQ